MPYVSCMLAPEDPNDPLMSKDVGHRPITCIDDQGRTWFLTEDSAVGDWLEYVANGGTVEPYAAPEGEG